MAKQKTKKKEPLQPPRGRDTSNILEVKGVPVTTKKKLFNIAARKGVPFSQYMRYQLAQLPDVTIEHKPEYGKVEIHSLPPAVRKKLERLAAARPGGGNVQDVIRDEFNRIIRETPEYMMMDRRED